MFRSRLRAVLMAAAVVVSACAGTPSDLQYPAGKSLKITKEIWSHYQEYLGTLRPQHSGVFVVLLVDDVGISSSYSYCPPDADRCVIGDAVNLAKQPCIENNVKCVLFARDQAILVPYEIVDN
jgi:hypothetical protein